MITFRLVDAVSVIGWLVAVGLEIVDSATGGQGDVGRWALLTAMAAATTTLAALRQHNEQSRSQAVEEGLRMAGIVKLRDHEHV